MLGAKSTMFCSPQPYGMARSLSTFRKARPIRSPGGGRGRGQDDTSGVRGSTGRCTDPRPTPTLWQTRPPTSQAPAERCSSAPARLVERKKNTRANRERVRARHQQILLVELKEKMFSLCSMNRKLTVWILFSQFPWFHLQERQKM